MIYTLGSMKYILAVTTVENNLCWRYCVRNRRHQGAMRSQMSHLPVQINDSCCHRCSVQLDSNTGCCGPQWTAVKLNQAASERFSTWCMTHKTCCWAAFPNLSDPHRALRRKCARSQIKFSLFTKCCKQTQQGKIQYNTIYWRNCTVVFLSCIFCQNWPENLQQTRTPWLHIW